MAELDLDAITAKVNRASEEVGALCEGQRWRMSIPARPDRDSDLIIAAGLEAVDELVAEVKRLRGELEHAQSSFRAADTAAGIQARRVERAEGKLLTLIARLHQMADAWDAKLPETIRTDTASGAIRATLEDADV